MTMRTILVPISAAEVSRPALEAALKLAERFGAHIEALHVRADPKSLVPYAGEGMNGSMIEEIMDVTEREGADRAVRSRAMFDSVVAERKLKVSSTPAKDAGVTIAWREEIGREDEVVALRGRLADLTVVGRPMRDSPLPSPITLEAALLETGRPILIAPPGEVTDIATHCAVCWEGTTEGARAVQGAMPILERAGRVTIITGVAGGAEPLVPPEDFRDYLAWHGVKGEVHRFDPKNTEIGAALLRESMSVQADLMVKGAYSQSRLRQMILGTRTRYIIAHTEIPVLLAH
jgi:nucleotide-binding universal stress UspA family protein